MNLRLLPPGWPPVHPPLSSRSPRPARRLGSLAWGLVLLLSLGACGGEGDLSDSTDPASDPTAQSSGAAEGENGSSGDESAEGVNIVGRPAESQGKGGDKGGGKGGDKGGNAPNAEGGDRAEDPDSGISGDEEELWVVYEQPEEPDYQPLYQSLRRSDFYGDVAQDINDMLALPSPIGVFFDTCGESNAFYSPDDQEILMCYELIADYVDLETDGDPLQESDYDDAVINASLFTFFHELGHALVDVLELPITGREEDVVDEFATLLLLWWEDETAVLAGAEQFATDALAETKDAEKGDYPYWDEHGLSAQRYYNVICLIYGSDPRYWRDLVKSRELPKDRAEQCPGEFEQKTYAWETLLDPYWE